MSRLTDIEQRIKQLEGGKFQKMCDAYLSSKYGYSNFVALGSQAGTNKTTKGTPDTYYKTIDDKYVLVMYTTQTTGDVFTKIFDDIKSCFDEDKTNLKCTDISEVIYCHTSSNLNAGQDKQLNEYCKERNVLLQLIGINQISFDLYTQYHIITRDFLELPIGTNQILPYSEFINSYNTNAMAAPLDTEFQFRDEEIEEINAALTSSSVVILTGQAGVGKTRLALECASKFITQHGYNLFCIRSNHLPIYEDLEVFIGKPGQYLLLIDDANQITGLNHIIQYAVKPGHNVKMIVTVREYAKKDVILDINQIVRPHIVGVSTLTDTEIESLISATLSINNKIYLDSIVRIAEGNARIAILAGRLAKEAGRLDAISDASQLYEKYYGKYLDDNQLLKTDKKLLAAAGIIAFFESLHLYHLGTLQTIFEHIGITADDFKEKICLLHALEIVDLCNDKAVRFSEQCLSNYLLKYVFIDNKAIPLDLVIKEGFTTYKKRTINALHVLSNVFHSNEVHSLIEKAIDKIWIELKENNDPSFFEYVKVFFQLNPVETLIILKEVIDADHNVDFNIDELDFNKENQQQPVTDDIINILCGYDGLSELPEALDLLFLYLAKRPDQYIQFYNAITQHLGITKHSELNDYHTQILLIQKFIEHSNNWTEHLVCDLFIRVSEKLISLVHRPSEMGRNNTFVLYTIPIHFSVGAQEYRKLIWDGLYAISNNPRYHDQIIAVLKNYGYYENNLEQELIEFDWTYISKLLSAICSVKNFKDCFAVHSILKTMKRLGIDTTSYGDKYMENSQLKLFFKLEFDEDLFEAYSYREQETVKKAAITEYVMACDTKSINDIIDLARLFGVNNTDNQSRLSPNSLDFVFIALESNRELYLNTVDYYLQVNTPLGLHPERIVQKLFDFLPDEEIYNLLCKYDYDMKNTWIYCYFCCLPEDHITEQHVEQLYEFLKMREEGLTASPYRKLDFLDKYAKYDDDIFLKCCRIIADKFSYSPFIVTIYFNLFFNPYAYKPDQILLKFKDDLSLLSEIYVKTLSADKRLDYDGVFFYAIYSVYPGILKKYIQIMLDKDPWSHHSDIVHLASIWRHDNYIDIMDDAAECIFDFSKGRSSFVISGYFENILPDNPKIENAIPRQDEWIRHYIDNNASDINKMTILFTAIAHFSSPRCIQHILHFTRINPDFEAFKKIPLQASSHAGLGSLIPYMEGKISFLKTLLGNYSGLKYLQHKKRIQEEIERWKKRIEDEQIHEMLRD